MRPLRRRPLHRYYVQVLGPWDGGFEGVYDAESPDHAEALLYDDYYEEHKKSPKGHIAVWLMVRKM